jgi:hypothetical protein
MFRALFSFQFGLLLSLTAPLMELMPERHWQRARTSPTYYTTLGGQMARLSFKLGWALLNLGSAFMTYAENHDGLPANDELMTKVSR